MKHATLTDLAVSEPVRGALGRFMKEVQQRAGDRIIEVVLYGSVARGQPGPESDVDLLVRWRGAEAEGRAVMAGVTTRIFLDTGVLLSTHVFSSERWNRIAELQTAFHENVAREGISVSG
ncbi:MAG TPA: nucleotidyltransferase domain-containing protein [Candidatus Thermoplasmatota archaeon]|nr:nucleotidyltransferase domain-containing protein [Candidatus Thermoplasmatota archaeon]